MSSKARTRDDDKRDPHHGSLKDLHVPTDGLSDQRRGLSVPDTRQEGLDRRFLNPERIVELQGTVGNAAVAQLLRQALPGLTAQQLTGRALNPLAPRKVHTIQRDKSGAQANVQQKMAAITEMFRARLPGNDEAAMTERYRGEVIINGLCGGWVELFLRYPDWVEPVYNAVRTWDRPADKTDAEALVDFESHLRKVTRFGGAANVVKLLRDAYEAMSRLEPKAGYDSLPLWTDEVAVGGLPESSTASEGAETAESTYQVKGRDAAKVVCDGIKRLIPPNTNGECMAHLESDIHHMALRVQDGTRRGKDVRSGLVITVVETERKGMVKVKSWEEAEAVLRGWLSQDEPNLQKIAVRTRTVGFQDNARQSR
jgi:hypothetical protein